MNWYILFGCCPTALVNISEWSFSAFSSYRAEATEIWKMGKFSRVAWNTRGGYKSEHSNCLYLLSGETTVKGTHSNEGTFFNILKLHENIPSISKTIEHPLPPPPPMHDVVHVIQCENKNDTRQTDSQTDGGLSISPVPGFRREIINTVLG